MTMDFERTLAHVRGYLADMAPGDPITLAAVGDAVNDCPWLLGTVAQQQLSQLVHDYLVGAGPLAGLLRDPTVTDVVVNGPADVWVERGHGLEPAQVQFDSEQHVRACAQRLAATAGRALDDAHPWVDAGLPDGRRLHAVIAPIAVGCTAISIRALPASRFTLADLTRLGMLTAQSLALVQGLVLQRRALLITGGTGSGKTTFLDCLLGVCDTNDRVVIAEDTTELSAATANVVRMQTRSAGHGGRGAVTLADLVRQALRMRPDRVVVGEVRGVEIVDLLMAMNTGHTGGMATLHANRASHVPTRVQLLGAASGLSAEVLDVALGSAIQAIIHLDRDAHGVRRVREIGVPLVRDDRLMVRPGWLLGDGSVDEEAVVRLADLASVSAEEAVSPGP